MTTSQPLSRGDVVLVDYPFSPGVGVKRRPTLVVQNDQDNAGLTNTIIAMITSPTDRVPEGTRLHVDISTPEGKRSGLRQDSAVNCTNSFAIEKRLVLQWTGFLSGNLMSQIDACLKATLQLP